MNLQLFIARRYLLSRKKTNFVNILSMISFLGICIGTAALIVVLSVFNGLQGLVGSMYSEFDPDLKIEAVNDKYFGISLAAISDIQKIEGVRQVSCVLEENALIRYNNHQEIARLKGIDKEFFKVSKLKNSLFLNQGTDSVSALDGALIGNSLAYRLGISLSNPFDALELYVPKSTKLNLLQPEKAFEKISIHPGAIFDVQPQINSDYVLIPMNRMRELLPQNEEYSALEIAIDSDISEKDLRQSLLSLIPEHLEIKNRFQQQEAIYSIFRLEKWSAFTILSFIVFIAALNLIASLSMLGIDKQIDLGVLRSMGASSRKISMIFFSMGLLLTIVGCSLGVILGTVLCLLQENFGLISIQGSGAFIVDSYPVILENMDLLIVSLTIFLMGAICSLYPSWKAGRQSANFTALLSAKN